MKNKLIITLLALTMTTAMLAGCGKETAEVQSADTEAVAEVSTETKAVAAETETEESTEGAELVYNTETDTEVVAKEDKTKPDKADAKTDSTGSTKDSVSKTDSKDAGTKNDSATQAPAETTTNTPAQTPAETPAPEPESEAPARNLCPYGPFDQWLDLGNGWWGYYTCFQSPDGTRSALDKEFADVIMTPDSTWTYDDWSTELVGNYDDAKDVILTKYHMVPITN
ncbi:MAG: hypothetical protein PUE83_12210 [Lachnobacterium sp.]|nr:hypothetical protein [Lachnobacterium sp.]